MAKTFEQLWAQRDRLYRLAWERTRKRLKKAHPATGGIASMVHNWGNAKAKAILADGERRESRILRIADRLYHDKFGMCKTCR